MVPILLLLAVAQGWTGGDLPSGGGVGSPQDNPRQVGPEPTVRLGLQTRALPFPVAFEPLPDLPYPLGIAGTVTSVHLPPSPQSTGGVLTGSPPGSLFETVPLGAGGSAITPAAFRRPGSRPAVPQGAASEGGVVQELPPFLQSEFAQLAVRLRGRGEFGGDWTRFRPCESGLQKTCDPGLFPQLKPDVQFGIQVGGTVLDRIQVDVDYDEAREFSAANNINIYYQGTPGEILQRVEVGDVTLSFPESRFLTRGIPAGNFGFRALTDMGPLEVQTVWAQQNGDLSSREFQLTGVGDRQAFVQEDTLVLDDADYVQGQFFFLVDPRALVGFPHLDVLSLDGAAAPPSVAPGSAPIQLYRFENDPVTRQQVEGYIQARAVAERDGSVVSESGWFRYLQPGVDYAVHPSGLWVSLRRPLRQDEMLAVTYVTVAGDTVGDYNPERLHNAGIRPTLELLKASGPKHQPGSPTWDREMHQIYRISGSDAVEPRSVGLTVSLGELSAGRTFKRRPDGEEITLLRLLGLDRESPVDELDPAVVYRPADDYFQAQPPVSGTFIVFPTLRPFAEPPPLPSLGLTAEETLEILGADANETIYESVDPVAREGGSLYRLTMPFRIRSEGVISTFSLGALGIRDGSERIFLGERLLRAGEDYLIDYDVGQVTLLNPEALFAAVPDARVRATWEQKAAFQIAPTSIFGLNARYDLGTRGALHLVGLYQQERTLQNRPQLGMEPASILLGGLNGALSFGAGWLDRMSDHLPGAGADTTASLDVRGELALSLPNPNVRGDVYLDDFDATDQLPLSLLTRDWTLGSAPASTEGVDGLLPLAWSPDVAGDLVWQHTWILEGPGGDSLGIFEGFFPRRDIDEQINIAGTETRQTGLRLSFDGDASPDSPGWRSVTTTLSNTGTDLTRSDFLEFYAAGGEALTLVLDLGRVSEDAMFLDSSGNTSGTHPVTGEPWGIGILDQEADPQVGEIWNDLLDQRGAWVEECMGARGRIFPLGDPRANCTRGNGLNDTEDLDGDGNLSTEDRVYRYVVKLDGSSPYLARTRAETGTSFQLYRIPLRGPRAINVGGVVTDADWRAVKHLRLTVVGSGSQGVSLTRLRLLGSRWVKRGDEGVLSGLAGVQAGSAGKVEVGPVSALSEGAGYESPPGVLDELDDPSQAYGGGGVEFNEKSLSIQVDYLGPGERAEVYSRFPQRPRDFLTYRQARLWVVGRDGDWGVEGGRFFLKVGSDPDNFYLFSTAVTGIASGNGVVESDWRPELVVDFEVWLDLRRRAEEELVSNPPAPGGPPLVVWSADSTYAVFLKDRARAPNLAAVREISLGIWNPTAFPLQGTVWVDELRLGRAAEDPGFAGHLDVELTAPGLLRTALSYSGKGAFFRQLSSDPSYQQDASLLFQTTLELGRVVPEDWGVVVPLSVTHSRLGQDPAFLAKSDVRADRLPNLRETGASDTRVEIGFRKTTPVGIRLLDPVLQGLSLRAGYSRNRLSTTTLESSGSGMDARADYSVEFGARDLPLVPGFAEGVVRALLPRRAEAPVLDSRLRWSPERLRLGTLYTRRELESFRFERILVLPEDAAVTPTLSPREVLESSAHVGFRPLDAVTAEATFFSVRDLLRPRDAIPDAAVQPLVEAERLTPGPLNLGWETGRNLTTRIGLRPSLAEWLRTDWSMASDYTMDRNPALVETLVLGPDTVLALQRNANGSRTTRGNVSLELAGMAEGLFGMGPEGDSAPSLARILGSFDPLSVSRQAGLSSRFFREAVNPGAGFQLAWGDAKALRILSGDTASIFTDRVAWTAGTGMRLPRGVRVQARYSDSHTQILHLRSDRDLHSRSWPDLRVTVAEWPLSGAPGKVLQSVSFGSGFRKTFLETVFGGGNAQARQMVEREVPLELGGRWVGSVATRYRGTFTRGEGEDPTGSTNSRRQSHSLTLQGSLADPPLLAERLDGPLRISIGYNYSSEANCRTPLGSEGCVPFVDLLNRSFNLTLDSVILPMEVGVHFNFTSRQSFVGRHDGSSQFQLGIFGQFLFNSGTFSPPSAEGPIG